MDIVYAEKYYNQVQERFPQLSKKQIDKIIKYGLRSFVAHTKLGGDIFLTTTYYNAYFGRLYNQSKLFAHYYALKMKIKLRIKYKRRKQIFNGKYYFGLKQDEYDALFGKFKKKTKAIHFERLTVYKMYEECILYKPDYVFEFEHKDDKFCKVEKNITIPRYHLIARRDKNGILEPVDKNVKYKWSKRYPINFRRD